MLYKLEFIGSPQCLHPVDASGNRFDLETTTGQIHIVDLRAEGPVMIVNGQTIMDDNTTIWITFPSIGGRIPYSPIAIFNHWRMAV